MSNMTPLPLTGAAAVWLAEQALASVVQVEDGGRGAGAGVAVDRRGLIVTNAHVARGRQVTITTNDGRRMEGRVVARDDALDLAAIRIERDDLHALQPGDSQALRPGQLVLDVAAAPGPSLATQPLTAAVWRQVQDIEKYSPETLQRLRDEDPELRPNDKWKAFYEQEVLPGFKRDVGGEAPP